MPRTRPAVTTDHEVPDDALDGWFDSTDPATGAHLGRFPTVTGPQVQAVISRARTAQQWWAERSFTERRRYLVAWAAYLVRHEAELVELVHREQGKTRDEAFLELVPALEQIRWAARHARASAAVSAGGTQPADGQRGPHPDGGPPRPAPVEGCPMKPARAHARVHVDAPIETVWAVLTDHEGMSAWSPGVSVELECRGRLDGLDAVRVVHLAGLTIREQVIEIDPPRRLTYRCLSGLPLRDYRGTVELAPGLHGTEVRWELAATTRIPAVRALLATNAALFTAALRRAVTARPGSPPQSAPPSTPPPAAAPQTAPPADTTAEASMPEDAPAPATVAEAFQRTVARDPGGLALSTPDGSVTLTWAQYDQQVRRVAAALYAYGMRRGDRVALMMANRPEFFPVDGGALHLGAAPFSIYNTSSPEQIRWLFGDADPGIVFCDRAHADRVTAAVKGRGRRVICVDAAPPGTVGLEVFLARGREDFDFEATWRGVRPDDVLTLIYTSGTTGDPKGVQITHANMLAEVAATAPMMGAGPGDRVLSFLPTAHIADRWACHYLQMVTGTTVYPLADRAALADAMRQVRPTMFGAVPQIWQKLRGAVLGAIAETDDPEHRATIERAIEIGRTRARARGAGEVPDELEKDFRTADARVLSRLRERLGLDQARVVMSGAAPVPAADVEFFNGLGIPLTDGWGMSELSCLAAYMPPDQPRIGSVGKPLDTCDVTLADDGEILVRGPIVMKGYLGRDDLTAEVLQDGWLHTGDIGRFDEQGYLYILDRKKEIIVNSGGKNISPAVIEGRLKAASPLIGHAVVIGDNRPFLTALIVLDLDAAARIAGAAPAAADPWTLAEHHEVLAAVREAVTTANGAVAPVEHVRKLAVLPELWEPGSEVLTYTMKLRRRPIAERYALLIDALYALPREETLLRVSELDDPAAGTTTDNTGTDHARADAAGDNAGVST